MNQSTEIPSTISTFKLNCIYVWKYQKYLPNGMINFKDFTIATDYQHYPADEQYFLCFKRSSKTVGFIEVDIKGLHDTTEGNSIKNSVYIDANGEEHYNFMSALKCKEDFDASIGGFETIGFPATPFEKRKFARRILGADQHLEGENALYEKVKDFISSDSRMGSDILECIKDLKNTYNVRGLK